MFFFWVRANQVSGGGSILKSLNEEFKLICLQEVGDNLLHHTFGG
jgi:hypothetical protein